MWGSGFKASKLKPQLKMAVSRFQISANKKSALLKQQMREVAVLLAEDPPREEKARIRAEACIREDNTVEAYEILQLECELLAERIKLLENMKDCPPDLVSIVSTIIWASDRVEISELNTIRKQFRAKYGKEFEANAINNVGGVLNERVVAKLSIHPPAAYLVQVYLERICEQHEVEWKPKHRLNANEMAEPMSAPYGYSVQVAGASGLGEVTTGTIHTDQEGGKTDDASSMGMGSVPAAAVATPYNPSAPPSAATRQTGGDLEEVDIFVPAIPAPPTNDPNKPRGFGGDDDDLPPAAPSNGTGPMHQSGGGGGSYANLVSRFNNLKS
uniref:IST1 homolog n=1 Tax=Grammatophora oceanica TaxID=210454 RepID=A0A7S1VRA9_9STRA|eukprot:CAMPEP_0194045506 /NCGR_PEP_ID=MMETSP0009_2-20130614/16826_1 /TAXON_ID=210454 /ORGANISM="Grammatophora oceanica, Strain CCMP 410" /LENGTH=327 /DNA_ID=CAMNT_0038690373 /DNA_START=107 /DNA_END=1090 /DNA_ORIENTATION=-